MENYEINAKTLAIIPINKEMCKIIEEEEEFVVELSQLKIIDNSCKFFGSSYEGRLSGTKAITGISHKAPIIIEESRKIIFFPIKSPRLDTCVWISFNNLDTYYQEKENIIIKFFCGKRIELNISYKILDNQVLRSSRIDSILTKRINL